MKININTLGLNLVLILIMLVLIHKQIASLFVYYREIFALTFMILILYQTSSNSFRFMRNKKFFTEIFLLILFPLIIIIFALIDPGARLYNDTLDIAVKSFDGNINPSLYILRNAVIYLPMLFYIAIRGLSVSDINKIASVIAFFAPISIVVYLTNLSDPSPVFEFGEFLRGKLQIEYNTFVTVFSLSVLSMIYLVDFNHKNYSLFKKFIMLSVTTLILLFIFYSTSRQALFLTLFYIVLFMPRMFSFLWLKNSLFYITALISIFLIYDWVSTNYGENLRLISRFTDTATTSSRIEIMLNGFEKIKFLEYFTGVGLTSVLVSGPHNDFIRWTQRIGLIFMFISFYPFLSAMIKSFFEIFYHKKDKVRLYIFCINLFIIYNSLFGYPREDVYQSLFCFLGVGIWLGYSNYNLKKKLQMQESQTF